MKANQILGLLNRIQGATFASMDCKTKVTLTGGKKNSMQGRVTKQSDNNMVMLFTNKMCNAYENMVNRRRAREGQEPNFAVEQLRWGAKVTGFPLITHKGKSYLQVIFLRRGEETYFLDGEPIAKEDIVGLKTNGLSGRQELDPSNAVIVRSYDLGSIRRLRMYKQEIEDEDEIPVSPQPYMQAVVHEEVAEDEFA